MRLLLWTLTWIVLVLGAAWYLWRKVRVTWRSSRQLGAELRVAERRLSEVREQVEQLQQGSDAVQELAVFGDAGALRAERDTMRQTLGQQRRARAAGNRPGWARRVDS